MSGKSQHKTEYGKKTICTDNAGQVCKFTCRHAELQLSVYGVQPQRNGAIAELSWHIVTQLLDKMSKSGNIELLDISSKGGAVRTWLLF